MMNRFVVLLRGVNVGKGNRVPMAEFRAAIEALGYVDARTLLNSGNAVFSAASDDTAELASAIAKVVEERFGVSTPVIVKSAAELATIVATNPIPPAESEHSRFLVGFTMDSARLRELESLSSSASSDERFVVNEHAAYLHCAGGLLESKVGAALVGRAGRGVTTRNWATVLKLAALTDKGA